MVRGRVAKGHVLPLPARRSDAPVGADVVAICERLGPADRETEIMREILAGNVPSFLRALAPIDLSSPSSGRRGRAWVTPDYLAVGSDSDFVRVPMAKRTAHDIAHSLGCILPTSRIVDAVYEGAACKLTSPAHGASARMASTELYAIHNREIEERRSALRCPDGAVVAGHKKDLVISPREAAKPGHLVIYGWFGPDGTPIQPLSLLHSDRYVDFSHGVRLVADEMEVDGDERNIFEVLRDPELSALVSNEGPFVPSDS